MRCAEAQNIPKLVTLHPQTDDSDLDWQAQCSKMPIFQLERVEFEHGSESQICVD